jgi:hypothetical protein
MLVHCYAGCSQRDLIEALQRRGLWRTRGDSSAPARRLSPLDEARTTVLAEAQRQMRRLEPYREMFADAELLRVMYRTVAEARRAVTAIGADDASAWDLARAAAALEVDALNWELALS